RRVTSVCRSSRSACTGVPGRESSARNSQSKTSCSVNPPSRSTVISPGRCLRTAPSWRKSAGMRLPPVPGTAMSFCSRRSWRTRFAEVPRASATSAWVSVSIGSQPMAQQQGDDGAPGTVPGARLGGTGAPMQRRAAAGGPAVPDDPGAGPDLLDLAELEAAAERLLPAGVWDYYAGGAESEVTVGEA